MSNSLRDIENARTLRSAALVLADRDPKLAQQLHKASQDLYESWPAGRYAFVTENSVYTAIVNSDGIAYVTGRATFSDSGYLPVERHYTGKVVTGPREGQRMVFLDPELGSVSTTPIVEVVKLAVG